MAEAAVNVVAVNRVRLVVDVFAWEVEAVATWTMADVVDARVDVEPPVALRETSRTYQRADAAG